MLDKQIQIAIDEISSCRIITWVRKTHVFYTRNLLAAGWDKGNILQHLETMTADLDLLVTLVACRVM
jgi:hypothetical protein